MLARFLDSLSLPRPWLCSVLSLCGAAGCATSDPADPIGVMVVQDAGRDGGSLGPVAADASGAADASADGVAPAADAALDASTPADAMSSSDAERDSASDAENDSDQQAADCTLPGLAPGDHRFTIKSKNGVTYDYILVVPRSLRAQHKAPLALIWHALSSSPEETRSLTDIDAQGEEKSVLMVHPVSPDQAWDVGSCCTAVWGMKRDETVFVRELLADVSSKVCVDDKHIYTSGFSNGGMISQMLACKMPDVFAAAAPMGSTLTIDPNDCHPSRPIPMFMINGTADPLVGYDSPSLSGGLAVPDDVALWAERNKCKGEPTITLQKGAVTCRTYDDCDGDVQVTSCVVQGMGHCLPGMKKESSTNCLTKLIPLGMPNDDVDAVQLATEFLLRY